MKNQNLKTLAQAQDKLRAIDKLSNTLYTLDKKQVKDVAHLIHRIIESDDYITSDLAREILHFQIESKKDLFIKV